MQSTTSLHDFKNRVKNYYSVSDDGKWMPFVKATLGTLSNRLWNLSIYKVPNKLRRLKEDAYNPHLVSIGPFHRSNHELVAMEEHKWHYMLHFLRRAAPPGTNYDPVTCSAEEANQGDKHPSVKALEECCKAISELEAAARDCYAENINLAKNQLVEILLVDGCFILEFFIKYADQNRDKDDQNRNKDVEEDCSQPPQELDPIINNPQELDPIINNMWMVPTLQHDLALLENQIPFVVLRTLFGTIQNLANKQFRFSLEEYVLLFFRSALNLNLSDEEIQYTYTEDVLHIAHLLHRVVYTPLLNFYPQRILKGREKFELGFKKCATELVNFGIQLQPGDDKHRRLLDITFSRGVITIPPLYVHEITYSIFRNVIAFEQCSAGCSHHIASSYAWLMKTLIRSPQDAELLRLKGIIITNEVRGDEEVSTFFQSLCRVVVVNDFCFSELCEEVNTYDKSLKITMDKDAVKVRWNGYIVTLHKEYFNSPWTIISVFAAFVLLCLTVLQTYYTIRSYYPH